VRERRPPFSPDEVTSEYAAVLKSYGLGSVKGDRYAGEWPRERFRKHGIFYEPSEPSASDYFRDMLPLLNAGRVELLDNERLRAQLVALERRTSRLGRDVISHPPGGHDDVANSVAGALVTAAGAHVLVITPTLLALSRVPTASVLRRRRNALVPGFSR
jgi:hypothetical protein